MLFGSAISILRENSITPFPPSCRNVESRRRAIESTFVAAPLRYTRIRELPFTEHNTAQSRDPLAMNDPEITLCGAVFRGYWGIVHPRRSRSRRTAEGS